MVQIDIPAAFVVSMLFIDLGRKVLKEGAEKRGREKPAIYYRYLFRSVFFAGYCGHIIGYRWLISGKAKYLRPAYIDVLVVLSIVVLSCYPSFF